MCNHHRVAIPSEGVFEESGELAVPVVDVVGSGVSPKGINAVPQGQQGAVDVGALDHTLASVLRSVGSVSDKLYIDS